MQLSYSYDIIYLRPCIRWLQSQYEQQWKTSYPDRNDRITVFFAAANKNRDNAQVVLASSYHELARELWVYLDDEQNVCLTRVTYFWPQIKASYSVFHLLQSDMVSGIINPFSWIFNTVSSEKTSPLPLAPSFPFLLTYIDVRFRNDSWTVQFFLPTGQFKFQRASCMQGAIFNLLFDNFKVSARRQILTPAILKVEKTLRMRLTRIWLHDNSIPVIFIIYFSD